MAMSFLPAAKIFLRRPDWSIVQQLSWMRGRSSGRLVWRGLIMMLSRDFREP
jgi:hypothetical protein